MLQTQLNLDASCLISKKIPIVVIKKAGQNGIAHLESIMAVILKYLPITLIYLGRLKNLLISRKLSLYKLSLFRVCSNPTHVDARERETNSSWLGSEAKLIFDITPKPETQRDWAWGISRKFGYFIFRGTLSVF